MKFGQYHREPLWNKLNSNLKVCIFLILTLFTGHLSAQSTSEQPITTINHYDKNFSPVLRAYLTEALKAVLDKSVSEYGPYRLSFYSRKLSTNRSKLETEKGLGLDILFASHWSGKYVSKKNVIAIEFSVLEGLLGLRTLIAGEEQNRILSGLESNHSFKQLSAGQGANWEDTTILRMNNIPVTEAHSFDSLLPMLDKKRYDYLPLSILEVRTTLRTKGIAFEQLTANRDIRIFYPMPFFLFVNAKKPDLAERVARGLEIARNDGTLATLFERHFGFVREDMHQGAKKLILLKNPLIDADSNIRITEQFLSRYQHFFDLML